MKLAIFKFLDITRAVTDVTFSGFNKTHALIKWKNGDIDRNNLINYIHNNETGQNVSTTDDSYYYPITDNSSYDLLLYSIEAHLLPSEIQSVHFVTKGQLLKVFYLLYICCFGCRHLIIDNNAGCAFITMLFVTVCLFVYPHHVTLLMMYEHVWYIYL